MKTNEVTKIKEQILALPFNKVHDVKLISELGKLYAVLSDFFSMVRMPNTNDLTRYERDKFREAKSRIFNKKKREEYAQKKP